MPILCQECTCKIDKSLNRRICIKFESRKIWVAGDQWDNSDFGFHNEDCQQLKPKGTQASFYCLRVVLTRYMYDAWRQDLHFEQVLC